MVQTRTQLDNAEECFVILLLQLETALNTECFNKSCKSKPQLTLSSVHFVTPTEVIRVCEFGKLFLFVFLYYGLLYKG